MANTHSIDLEKDSSQYATAADSASLSFTGNLTFEFWVKLASQPASGAYMFLINKDDIASQRSYGLAYMNGINFPSGTQGISIWLFQTLTASRYTRIDWVYTLPLATWTHVAIAVTIANPSTTKAELYINGVSQGNGTPYDAGGGATSIADGTAILEIGRRSDGYYFDGKIDDIRLWNVVRTATEINNNKSVEIDTATGLNASWHLNNVYTDSSGNANTLTPINSPVFSTDVPFSGVVGRSQGHIF